MMKFRAVSARAAFAAVLLLLANLNMHYPLFGDSSITRCLMSSSLLMRTVNAVARYFVCKAMAKEGIPEANRSEQYAISPEGISLQLDIYEPPSMSEASDRPALLYFHAGAFTWGFRELGRHICAWLAEQCGVVGFTISYRLNLGGCGVAGAIEDAWLALQWLQSNAARLKIDPKKIVVMGDSAGGLLTAALATGLRPSRAEPAPLSELPAAAILGWGAVSLQSKHFIPSRSPNGLGETPEADKFDVPCMWVPKGTGTTAAACQTQLQKVIAGQFLAFGLNKKGWLPASTLYDDDKARSISPLSLATRRGLPPMFAYSAGADEVVPCSQQELFVERYRSAGNSIAQVIYAKAAHGGGGVNCPAGREAILKFLEHHKIISPITSSQPDSGAYVEGFMRVLGTKSHGYAHAFEAAQHINSTLHLPAISEAAVPKDTRSTPDDNSERKIE